MLTSDRKKNTALLGEEELKQALRSALQAGPQAIGQQIRYILAHSQMLNLRPFPEDYREKPLGAAQARIAALVEFVPALTEKQALSLAKDTQHIKDPQIRMSLIARLIAYLPRQRRLTAAREVWKAINEVDDPVIVTRLCLWMAPALQSLPEETQISSVLPDIIEIAQSIGNTEARIRSLLALATHVPEPMALRMFWRVVEDLGATNNDTLRSNVINAAASQLPSDFHTKLIDIAHGITIPNERARVFTHLAQLFPEEDSLRDIAIDAISTIRSEEERADALMAFKPSLENASVEKGYPKVLEKALTVAIGISRRPLRARALVALSSYLTPDLQGEALAAVHSLTNERDRARLLGDLAPHLPNGMLVASLAVAHTMREQDARVHALGVLAHYVPENARNQTMLDALAAASNLPHHYERVQALIELVDILPPQLQMQAFTSAVETTRVMENENARARALSLLGHHLPPHLLERAVDAAYLLKDPQQRLNTLASMMPRLTAEKQDEALQTMLECARQMPFEYKRARALITLAPHLKPDAMQSVMEIAETIIEPYDHASALIAIVQNMPPEQRPPLVMRAWQLIAKVEDGYDRASALASLAPLLPPHLQQSLPQLVGMVIGSIMDEYDQASAISILAPHLVDQEKQGYNAQKLPDFPALVERGVKSALAVPYQITRIQLLKDSLPLWLALNDDLCYRLWQDVAEHLKTLPLADVLSCLGALKPVIHRLAGDEGVAKVTLILGIQ